MSTLALHRTAPLPAMVLAQTRAEFLKLLRVPAFSIFSLAFPLVLYGFFGLPNASRFDNGVNVGAYILASLATYGVVSVMLFSFGIGVANERSQRMNVLMRATPLPGSVALLAKVFTALAFALAAQLLLYLLGVAAGGVHLSAARWLQLLASLLLGSLPFIALGFGIGYSVSPNVAPALVNLLFLPLSFASGLFVPLSQMPQIVQNAAPYLPTYRLGQLAWAAVGASTPSLGRDVLWLAAWGLGFTIFALRAYGREETKEFG
ncbi:MAG: ABC transporter permease [Chloroflexi bacterium]|nr:ABC transporter permease [Chloroflexota bacterium]